MGLKKDTPLPQRGLPLCYAPKLAAANQLTRHVENNQMRNPRNHPSNDDKSGMLFNPIIHIIMNNNHYHSYLHEF
jgi:hypothetical protein